MKSKDSHESEGSAHPLVAALLGTVAEEEALLSQLTAAVTVGNDMETLAVAARLAALRPTEQALIAKNL